MPPSFASRTRNRTGFTLIELLVVIVIIAVLASIALPSFSAAQNRARKVQAVNDLRNTKTAIFTYYGDYHKYPIPTAQIGVADIAYGVPGGTNSTADLFDILRAFDDGNVNGNNVLNPSQTVYWSGKFAASATKPREGITTQPVTVNGNTIPKGSLVDPWGNSYLVYIDGDGDGDLTTIIAQQYADAGTVQASSPPLGVAFASLGPDGVFGAKVGAASNGLSKNSDDIVSWQQ